MITNRNNFLTTHFLPNLHQRHRIHRSLTIKTPNLLSNEYHQSSQQKIQLDLHHESPLLIRSLRPINEEQISKNQLQLTPRTSTVHSKLDKKIFPHLKSHLLKHSNSHYQSRIEKSTSFSDLFISPRSIKNDFQIIEKTNMNKNPIDECKYSTIIKIKPYY